MIHRQKSTDLSNIMLAVQSLAEEVYNSLTGMQLQYSQPEGSHYLLCL